MKYKKDKRTKNLTLRDIHVGDWVQVWSEITERYSPPLKIISIHDDGTIYLVTSDDERPTPWEEDVKNVDALDITRELLEGLGFEVIEHDYPKDEYNIIYNGKKLCELWVLNNSCTLETSWQSYEYFHEFIDDMCDEFPEILNLKWKGILSKKDNTM